MDDIDAMRQYWVEAEPPSPGAQDRALTALLAEATRPDTSAAPVRARAGDSARSRFRLNWGWRIGVATVAAAALAAGLVVTTGPNGDPVNEASVPQAQVPPVGDVMELAAAFAAAQPFTQPRPDQWAYVELKITGAGVAGSALRKSWYRIDGSQIAIPDENGHIQITTHPEDVGRVGPKPALNPHDYPSLAAMPVDPQALLTFLRDGLEAGADPDSSLFGLIGYILRENVLPPELTAALLRAAAQLPGVAEVPGTVTVDGRDVIAVGRVDGWSREELLLDPSTKEFLGSRAVAVEDQPSGTGERAGPDVPPVQRVGGVPAAKQGDVVYVIMRGTCTIVDAPGQVN